VAKPKKLLVVVDPTASFHPAIERASWLARHSSALIELFISDYAPHWRMRARTEWRQRVCTGGRARSPSPAPGTRGTAARRRLGVDVDVRWDYPLHDSIVRKALESGADFVIRTRISTRC
jgi:universal stress protein E